VGALGLPPHPITAMRDQVKLQTSGGKSWTNVIWCRQASRLNRARRFIRVAAGEALQRHLSTSWIPGTLYLVLSI
jgi:hypothetical protein